MKHETTNTSNSPGGFRPHRLALLTWAVAWPVITLLLEILQPLVRDWPLPLRTLLLSALVVALLSLVLMPRLTWRFAKWLRGESIITTQTPNQINCQKI